MPTISTNDFKNGITIVYDGQLWDIIEFQFVKPGKGTAFVRSKLKNVRTGQVLEPTFDSKHAVHLVIEMEGGDPTEVTRWLRDSTEGDFTVAIHQDGARTKIDIGLPISRHDVEELKRDLEREFDSLKLPSGARVEIKDPDEDD